MTTTPTTTTTTPPSTPILYGPLNIEYLNESWCELQYKSGCSSTGSISHLNHSVNPEILEKLLQEAQKDASSQRQSPTLLPAPQPIRVDVATNPSVISADSQKSTEMTSSSTKPSNRKQLSSSKMSKSATTEAIPSKSDIAVAGAAEAAAVPIKTSVSAREDRVKMSAFGELDYDYDDDVDLEYVEDDNDDDDDDTNVIDENGDMNSYGTVRSKIAGGCMPKSSCDPSASTPCPNCLKQKKQIDLLIERQVKNEKELIRMRNEYEVKLLNKSLELSTHPSQTITGSSSSSSSSSARPVVASSHSDFNICVSSSRSVTSSSSGANTPGTPLTHQTSTSADPNAREWMKYFASRPQTQPPKEWNFVHPNSSKSKYANFEPSKPSTAAIMETTMSSKLLSRESIGKLIFTHMASFIVGATLMFLVLKRHLNFKNSVYFI